MYASVALTLIVLSASLALANTPDPQLQNFRDQIATSCKASIKKKTPKEIALCDCIAKKHYESAALEPDASEAKRRMTWAVETYAANAEGKERKSTSEFDQAMSDYDGLTAEECLKEIKASPKKK